MTMKKGLPRDLKRVGQACAAFIQKVDDRLPSPFLGSKATHTHTTKSKSVAKKPLISEPCSKSGEEEEELGIRACYAQESSKSQEESPPVRLANLPRLL